MKNTFIKLGICLFCFIGKNTSMAQDMLKNDGIIQLQASKFSEDIILTKIKAGHCKFNLTSEGIIQLKNYKISDNIIKAMLEASPPTEIMVNEDIIKLCHSEISNFIIIEKIERTLHWFEINANGLIELKKEKVPEAVIKEMILNPRKLNSSISVEQPEGLYQDKRAEQTPKCNDKSTESLADSDIKLQIAITKEYDDVKGLKRLGELYAEESHDFENEEALRENALFKIKQKALEKGATHFLIQSVKFASSPSSKIAISGVAYK
ncbi:MAG: hypothetical protein KA313_02895 [Pseudarcicella sp.]|jgi:hypothetical protein|nr:hypothetical protein [Pseudarcicella sp.]MBP6410025.1 hypothetical protein [Pseudarcicella sp.]